MGRRSRTSAKTGEKNLYKSLNDGESTSRNDDDDPMHDVVDRFHNQKAEDEDMLLLDQDGSDDDEEEVDDGITTNRESVFDLGGGESSSSEDDDSDGDDADSDKDDDRRKAGKPSSSGDDSSSVPSSDEDSEDEDADGRKSGLLNWGDKKHSYYHGDTADLEIGQDVEDAHLELEAGREVERARLEDMEDQDFMLDDDDDDAKAPSSAGKRRKRDEKADDADAIETLPSHASNKRRAAVMDKLSKKERTKILKTSHPELLPLVKHFRGPVSDLATTMFPAGAALLKDGGGAEAEAVGATPAGMQYLITKSMIQASAALNLTLYLLLKADRAIKAENESSSDAQHQPDEEEEDDGGVQDHPVMDRLNQLSKYADKLHEGVEEKLPGLKDQLTSLVKAASLMENGDESSSGDDTDEGSGSESDDNTETSDVDLKDGNDQDKGTEQNVDDLSSSSDDDESPQEDEKHAKKRVMTEARFSLRHQDTAESRLSDKSRRRRRLAPATSDFGDDDEFVNSEKAVEASRKLATTMNSIAQRSASMSGKGKKKDTDPEAAGGEEDEFERFERGLAMMDSALAGDDDGENDGDGLDDVDDLADDDEEDDGFYQKIQAKTKAKKEAKEMLYSVAPKYPRLDKEVEGERALGNFIMKNRGLVAHKAKINRNPRVKKREQYRKAIIKRKGAVREVRTEEGHAYGGEATGIKSGITHSRKLGVRK